MSSDTAQPRKLRIRPPTLTVSSEIPQSESRSLISLYEIIPAIFISGYEATKNLDLLVSSGITHILNLAGESKCPNCYPDYFKYHSLKMPDNPKLDVLFFLYFSLDFIIESLKASGRVLVHCVKGTSRAAAVVLAYLMINGYTEQDAYSCLLNSQPTIDPNFGFVCQLKEWGKEREEEREYGYSERFDMFVNEVSNSGCRIRVVKNSCVVFIQKHGKGEELALECARLWSIFNPSKATIVYL